MPQGTLKSKPPGAKNAKNKVARNAGITKRGARTIAPKKAKLVEISKTQKKLSAQLAAGTERRLAARAGHLELVAGGKKDK